jgi:hypothetical protein
MSLFCDAIVILAYMKITADAIISLHSVHGEISLPVAVFIRLHTPE